MKKTVIAVIITFVLTVGLCVSGFFLAQSILLSQKEPDDDVLLINKIREIDDLISERAIFDFDKKQALENALSAYVRTLDDKYAEYFSKDYYDDYLSEIKGEYTGVGIDVSIPNTGYLDDNGFYILRVIGNSPAEKAGISACDYIVAVDGVPLKNMAYSDAVNMVVGEVDTKVTLSIKSGDEISEVTLTRTKFMARDVDYRKIGDLGYIKIYNFAIDTTYNQFLDAIDFLTKEGVKGFIYDVRDNPGGDYESISSVLNALVPKDELVVFKYKNDEDVDYSTGNIKTSLPSVVLVDKGTASAAELFASAMRDLNKSPLIGETTYGKGVGQNYTALSDGSGIKLTTFYYATKSRTNYDGIGLVPDYEVKLTEKQYKKLALLNEKDDPQLQKAIEVLKTLIK